MNIKEEGVGEVRKKIFELLWKLRMGIGEVKGIRNIKKIRKKGKNEGGLDEE